MRFQLPSLGGSTRLREHHFRHLLHDPKGAEAAQCLDEDTIPPIFKTYAGLRNLRQGISLHAAVTKKGFGAYTSISNSIMSFYIKCDMTNSALEVFRCMQTRDSISWNVVIHGAFQGHGPLKDGLRTFVDGRSSGFEPNVSTLVLILQACWKLEAYNTGKCIHGFATRGGHCNDMPIQNSLLCMYTRFHRVKYAELLFDEMRDRDVISWSLMISLYARCGDAWGGRALRLFKEMMCLGGSCIDGLTLVGVLQACRESLVEGKPVHGQVVHRGYHTDVFVCNSLVDMYLKCSDMDSAYTMFVEMPERNVVTWNTLLSGMIHGGQYADALEIFETMSKSTTIIPDDATIVSLLQLSKLLGQSMWCKCLHGAMVRRSDMSNLVVVNTLLDAYAKCGLSGLSTKVFDGMGERNLISWSTMIAGYAHCGMPDEAVRIFTEMMLAKEKPNAATILSVVEACALSTCLNLAKSVHGVAFRNHLCNKVEICTSLLDMYGKCGEPSLSKKVFDEMPDKNVVTWSAMIGVYGMNGRALEAVSLFHNMRSENRIRPNKITMLSVLTACSHGGLVEEGLSCFLNMLTGENAVEPDEEHYSCVIDMLGRAGDIKGAMELIDELPEEISVSASAWGALLSACRNHPKEETVLRKAASRLIELEPLSSSSYLLASGTVREERANMRLAMREKGVRIVRGYSLMRVNQKTHRFLANDGSHPDSRDIYLKIDQLHRCMKLESKWQFHVDGVQ